MSLVWVPKSSTTLYIIGDSTAANKLPTASPETGWGMDLQPFFTEDVRVDNRAVNGRSTKSFINEKNGKEIFSILGTLFFKYSNSTPRL